MNIRPVIAFVASLALGASALAQPAPTPETSDTQKDRAPRAERRTPPIEHGPMSLDLSHLSALAFDLGDLGARHMDLSALHAFQGFEGLNDLSGLHGLADLQELAGLAELQPLAGDGLRFEAQDTEQEQQGRDQERQEREGGGQVRCERSLKG